MSEVRKTNRLRAGPAYVWRGFGLIRQPRIRRFVVIPLLINVLLFSLGIGLLVWGFDGAMDRFLPSWLEWLRYILWPLLMLAALVIIFYAFSILANIVAGPFNGMLAAAVERHLTGTDTSTSSDLRSMSKEIARSLGAEIRKLAYFLIWALPFIPLFFIPGINVLVTPLWFCFGAWMLAIEYVDCPLGNHARPFPAARIALKSRRRLALGFGGSVMLLTMIPVVNFFAMPVGVAGATALYLDELSEP